MNLPKTVLIGGVATVIVLAGAGAYLARDSWSGQSQTGESLLLDYRELLETMNAQKTKDSLLGACDNPQKFTEQIKDLEDKLSVLQRKKISLINTGNEDAGKEWIPPIPGSEPLELTPDPESNEPADNGTDEWIPPIPGSEPPELTPTPGNDADSAPVEEEFIPRPGSQVPDLGEPTPAENEEWIPPIPGSEPPELTPDPGSNEPASNGTDEWIPPVPGSEPPELTPTPGNDADSAPVEEEFIPKIGAQPLELDPTPGNTIIDKINYLEKEIIAELNSLKSLCDKEEKKEIISTSCEEACQKYAHCASYTEGVTKEDLKDAYDTCFEECKTWSEKTIICINKKPITAPIDCENLGYCALPEYGGGYKK